MPTGEYFEFDQFKGWFDEFGYYYDANGTPCQAPVQQTAPKDDSYRNKRSTKESAFYDPIDDMFEDDDDTRPAKKNSTDDQMDKVFAKQQKRTNILEKISEKYVKGDKLPFAVDYKLLGSSPVTDKDFLEILKRKNVDFVTQVIVSKEQDAPWFKIYAKTTEDVDKILGIEGYKDADKNVELTSVDLLDLLNKEEIEDEEYAKEEVNEGYNDHVNYEGSHSVDQSEGSYHEGDDYSDHRGED